MAETKIKPLTRELQYYRTEMPYVAPIDREAYLFPTKYPQEIDFVFDDWQLPTQNLRPSQAQSIQETLESGFKRMGYEAKMAWGAAPFRNDIPFNIAAANGHPNGMVGKNSNYLHQDLDMNYGGGFIKQ